MKREILFRGKRIDNGEWVEGDLVHRNGKIYVFPQDGLDSADRYEVIPETVGQFTGLTDKNGKKIFEGDYAILKDSKGQMRLKCVYVAALYGYFWERSIYLNKHGLWLDSLDKFESHRNIEIIGNIHDKEE